MDEYFINFILSFLLSPFITNYNQYQFIKYIIGNDFISTHRTKFYMYKLMKCINLIFKPHLTEYKTKIMQIIQNMTWEKNDDEDIYLLLNNAIVHYMSILNNINLFDCSDKYMHGIIPEFSESSFEDDFIILNNGSRGASSEVIYCTLKINPTYKYVLKGNCNDDKETALRIDHPFIVKYFKIYPTCNTAVGAGCILELCYALINYNDIYYKYFGKELIIQLIFALSYLEDNKISHGDLHVHNMMIGRDGYFRLIDFDRTLNPSKDDYLALKDLLIGSGKGSATMSISPFKQIIENHSNDQHFSDFRKIV
jgi:hypothetical protein